ncbi:SusC/RagA family TonB-linked outer membrane protein [Flavihumibacter rivuli]|uniref:SusC/RagA family TonB-linked outer membrane protein n=1 Tax=Flavihumibacter rivuli TaxID=2838156 RepID=UPI001BDF3B16|nr:SusC/RagA family TonB-linked outer membrane protein [Flavihumibacter rivuli]ULQ55448.1 SusC/RagA family TonB-linked outer membrane protein [Flavihumibacter rivuli]
MKLLGILLFVVCLDLHANLHAQEIRLRFNQAKLETVLRSVEQQSQYRFIYSSEAMAKTNPVTIDLVTSDIHQVLKICLTNQPLSFTLEESIIILKYLEKPTTVPQQSPPFQGLLLDEQGQPVVGATITVKGTDRSAMSDEKGQFSLVVSQPGDVLVITSVAFETLEWPVKGRSGFTFRLQKKVSDLDEAVVKGYYKSTKRLNTGSVSTITAKVLESQPVSNPLSAIQGRATGVYINTQNGLPGGNITVQIRGQNSLNAGNEPLYVVDGVPFVSAPLNQGASIMTTDAVGAISPLNSINPKDIESIQILKDADATAIYGARGSNGVVLITTKKASSGKLRLSVDLQHGFSEVAQIPQLLSLKDYLMLRREAFRNDGITPTASNAPDLVRWDTSKGVNWADYYLGNRASLTNGQLSLTGGNNHSNFQLSGHYRTEGSVLPGNNTFERYGANFRYHFNTPGNKFYADYSGTYSNTFSDQLAISGTSTVSLAPNIQLYNQDGSYSWQGISGNLHPIAMLNLRSKSATEFFQNNIQMGAKLTKNIMVKLNAGLSRMDLNQRVLYPKSALNPAFSSAGYANFGDFSTKTIILEPQLDFSKGFNWIDVNATLGGSWQHSNTEGLTIMASEYTNDYLLENPGAAGKQYYYPSEAKYKYASVFARFNANIRDRYLINIVGRRDGSSRFGPGKQYGNFGAIGIGWLFSNTQLVKNELRWLNYGKIRASYGLIGNDQIGDYSYLETYSNLEEYQGIIGLNPDRFANALFGWETNRKLEIAAELGFFQNRVNATIAWYRNISNNQLLEYPIPFLSGPFGSVQANQDASIENSGVEIDASVVLIRKQNLQWSINGNITFLRNRLLEYPALENSSFSYRYQIGKDVSIIRGFDYDGIDPNTGLPVYIDYNKDGLIRDFDDYSIIGKNTPANYGGFGSTLSWKGLQFDLFFQFASKQERGLPPSFGTMANRPTRVLERWQNPGDITDVPLASTRRRVEITRLGVSDAVWYNASYVRFKNLSIGYQWEDDWFKKLRIQRCKVYFDAQNIFSWFKNDYLFDPETSNTGIAPLRSFVMGVQLNF